MSTFTENELDFLTSNLKKATHYIEFGCGESTEIALNLPNIESIISFETNLDWINKVKLNQVDIDCYKLDLVHIDLGPVKEWGYPINLNEVAYSTYDYQILRKLPTNKSCNLILIDGRFRVKTTLMMAYLFPKTPILVHDFAHRDEYFDLVQTLWCIEMCGSFAKFIKADTANDLDLLKLIQRYRTDPR